MLGKAMLSVSLLALRYLVKRKLSGIKNCLDVCGKHSNGQGLVPALINSLITYY